MLACFKLGLLNTLTKIHTLRRLRWGLANLVLWRAQGTLLCVCDWYPCSLCDISPRSVAMSTMVNKQATGIILPVLCLRVCAGHADKVCTKIKRAREGQTSASLYHSVQSCKNKPNAAFKHFYLREDIKRLCSKIGKTSNSWGKKKLFTPLAKRLLA